MFLSTYIKIAILLCISLGSAYITHEIDYSSIEKAKTEAVTQALKNQTEIINKQSQDTQKAQNEKDALQAHYEFLLNQYRGIGLHDDNSSSNQPASIAIPKEGLRLLESDAEFLFGFAKSCAITEIERNEVIDKYNDLTVK